MTTTRVRKDIYVTESDLQRLERLLEISKRTANVEALSDELGRAIIVEAHVVPPDLVTMNSTVRFRDDATGEETELSLVYPQDADIGAGKVSVLAPVGSALLGLSVGQSIEWPMPTGQTRRLRLEAVLYQPEATSRSDEARTSPDEVNGRAR
jgi:regulator of nucleoside diphosphate kinase